jgi:hypothetical protein
MKSDLVSVVLVEGFGVEVGFVLLMGFETACFVDGVFFLAVFLASHRILETYADVKTSPTALPSLTTSEGPTVPGCDKMKAVLEVEVGADDFFVADF